MFIKINVYQFIKARAPTKTAGDPLVGRDPPCLGTTVLNKPPSITHYNPITTTEV